MDTTKTAAEFKSELIMTTAEEIAEQFEDGSCWISSYGDPLEDLCEAQSFLDERDGDSTRYSFSDGSVIVAYPSGWDIGYRDCWCMRGAGHRPECSEVE